jgi:RNA polymerase sigma factor (sigma-70 family)
MDPEGAFAEAERAQRLRAAIDRLPSSRREAVRLFLQGFTDDEIAELLGCDRNRAHNLTYRGTRQLKKELSE